MPRKKRPTAETTRTETGTATADAESTASDTQEQSGRYRRQQGETLCDGGKSPVQAASFDLQGKARRADIGGSQGGRIHLLR